MPTTTINNYQREGLYELVRNHLGSIGDVWTALEETQDFETAERLGIEFGEDFRLLEDLGWHPNDNRQTVALTMPSDDLAGDSQRDRRARRPDAGLHGSHPFLRRGRGDRQCRQRPRRESCRRLRSRGDGGGMRNRRDWPRRWRHRPDPPALEASGPARTQAAGTFYPDRAAAPPRPASRNDRRELLAPQSQPGPIEQRQRPREEGNGRRHRTVRAGVRSAGQLGTRARSLLASASRKLGVVADADG